MMYSNGFALAVKKNGNTLREVRRDGRMTTFLPFNSEYSIFLKNNNDRRALVNIFVDGTLAVSDLVIRPNWSGDIERFLVDGNLDSGRKFKFVSLDHPDVQDPSSQENGVIKAEFWLEKEFRMPAIHVDPWDHKTIGYPPYRPWTKTDDNTGEFTNTGGLIGSSGMRTNSISSSMLRSCNVSKQSLTADAGATVEGGYSGQSFGTTTFGIKEPNSTILEVCLRSSDKAVTVKDTRNRKCVECGRKARKRDNFCPGCGASLPDLVSV